MTVCCRNGDPFQGSKGGSCLTLGDELSIETHMLTKQGTLLGRGAWGEEEGKGAQEACSYVARSLGFYGDVSFRGSLASLSDSGSFLVVHALLSQGGCQREGFWEVVGHLVSPLDPSQTLLVGGCVLVSCSSPGPPVIK